MTLRALARIARTALSNGGWRGKRGVHELMSHIVAGDRRSRAFAHCVAADLLRYLSKRPDPVEGDTLRRAHLAARWLARAQDVTRDGGLSHGYFPFRLSTGWRDSYPETSGYTIPTLFAYAEATGNLEYRDRAVRMAMFVADCQMPSGAIYGGTVRSIEKRVPVAFNTGMALLGFSAAYRATSERLFRECARKAADFLVNDIDEDGHFRSQGPFVHRGTVKTHTSLCAWPLFLAGEDCGCDQYMAAAFRCGDAALRQQQANGWFANNCLSNRVDAPLLHTIAYTFQGLLELGIVSGEHRYVDAARRGMDGLLPHCRGGFLHGRWFSDWQPASLSSCLTGAAQIGVVCYRLAEHTGDERYRHAADLVLNSLKPLQQMSDGSRGNLELVGGIGGSFPLVGEYMSNGFPGWAAKFYLDALLHQYLLETCSKARRGARIDDHVNPGLPQALSH